MVNPTLNRLSLRLRRPAEWIPVLGIGLILAVFAWMTWAHWGNLRIDSKELYVPQQIAKGRMLYRDLFYPYGPLTPYWNGLLFRIFGDHLNVLYLSGLAATLTFALVLFSLSRRFVPRFVAFIASFCFLLQAFRPGLFNYVLPYSYAASLGSLFSLIFLYLLIRHIRNESGSNLVLAGVVAGLAVLTKVEFGTACYLTVGFFLACQAWSQRSARTLWNSLFPFLPGVLIVIASYGWLVWRLSLDFFLKDAYGWQFYAQWARRQGFRLNVHEILGLLLVVLISIILWFAIALAVKSTLTDRWQSGLLRGVLYGTVVFAAYLRFATYRALWPYYLIHYILSPSGMFWLAIIAWAGVMIKWYRTGYQRSHLALATVCFHALVVGARIMSLVQPLGYAIYYNSPLLLVFSIVLVWIGETVARNVSAKRKIILISTLFVIEGLGMAVLIFPWRHSNDIPLKTDRGTIYAPTSVAGAFPGIIHFIQEQKQQGKTVLVLPEETSLYFFARVEAPSRWYLVHPGLLEPEEKELEYIREIKARGVDYILLSNRASFEYGYPFFGLDYNKNIYNWIQTDFRVVGEFGHFSRRNPSEFGMLIYQRRPPSETTTNGQRPLRSP